MYHSLGCHSVCIWRLCYVCSIQILDVAYGHIIFLCIEFLTWLPGICSAVFALVQFSCDPDTCGSRADYSRRETSVLFYHIDISTHT